MVEELKGHTHTHKCVKWTHWNSATGKYICPLTYPGEYIRISTLNRALHLCPHTMKNKKGERVWDYFSLGDQGKASKYLYVILLGVWKMYLEIRSRIYIWEKHCWEITNVYIKIKPTTLVHIGAKKEFLTINESFVALGGLRMDVILSGKFP